MYPIMHSIFYQSTHFLPPRYLFPTLLLSYLSLERVNERPRWSLVDFRTPLLYVFLTGLFGKRLWVQLMKIPVYHIPAILFFFIFVSYLKPLKEIKAPSGRTVEDSCFGLFCALQRKSFFISYLKMNQEPTKPLCFASSGPAPPCSKEPDKICFFFKGQMICYHQGNSVEHKSLSPSLTSLAFLVYPNHCQGNKACSAGIKAGLLAD